MLCYWASAKLVPTSGASGAPWGSPKIQRCTLAFPFLQEIPRGSGNDPSPCACLMLHMCCQCPPDGRDRGSQLLQQDPHCHRHLKPEKRSSIPGVNPREHPQINSGTKAHRGEVQAPQSGWFAEHCVFLFPESRVSLSCRDSHQSLLWHQHSPCWCQKGAAG